MSNSIDWLTGTEDYDVAEQSSDLHGKSFLQMSIRMASQRVHVPDSLCVTFRVDREKSSRKLESISLSIAHKARPASRRPPTDPKCPQGTPQEEPLLTGGTSRDHRVPRNSRMRRSWLRPPPARHYAHEIKSMHKNCMNYSVILILGMNGIWFVNSDVYMINKNVVIICSFTE